jgi:hypothetical protein
MRELRLAPQRIVDLDGRKGAARGATCSEYGEIGEWLIAVPNNKLNFSQGPLTVRRCESPSKIISAMAANAYAALFSAKFFANEFVQWTIIEKNC